MIPDSLKLQKSVFLNAQNIRKDKFVDHKSSNIRTASKIASILDSDQPFNIKIRGLIREIHNRYGWKAKDDLNELGLCSGAFFYTENFLKIAHGDRTGKIRDYNKIKVHIEHTIPVHVIYQLLISQRSVLKSADDVIKFIFKYSVCTAFSEEERSTSVKKNFNSCHPDIFPGSSIEIDKIRPFKRYSSDVKIYSVVTQGVIPPNITLKEIHQIHYNKYIIPTI
tara:strand:+ start:705 stop:1373 length:669 start_codon:yes stop_codon:yes gene_type:complete